ncbi:MAG: LamG-like jellyroll fold domain-containing protein [Saprospiraceae bacterium]
MSHSTPRTHLLCSLLALVGLFFANTATQAQNVGDLISVKAFDFQSTSRDTMIQFPDLQGVTYEKIMLKYTMRCKDALVSTSGERNKGCGEWDYSCNTYLVDSTKFEEAEITIADNHITNITDDFFDYRNDPVTDFLQTNLIDVQVVSTTSETESTVGMGSVSLGTVVPTDKTAGKSYYLYTASDLQAAGLVPGNINAISLPISSAAGNARHLRVKFKMTTEANLEGAVDFDGFQEVYRNNVGFSASTDNKLHFHTPFTWNGTSNVLVEMNFSNLGMLSSQTTVTGSATTEVKGLASTNEQQLYLTNNAYIEVGNYKGVGGSQNRTVEAWVKTSTGTSGEIASWGINSANRKWVFRFANGLLRVENGNGGTVSATAINDGEWHHVAAVLNGDNLTDISFYIDGQLDGNSAVGTTPIDTEVGADGFNFRISRGVNNRYLNAEIDDVRVWDTNLAAGTINTWKNIRLDNTHPNYTNLQLYFPFEDAGNTVADMSGNGRDGAVIGSKYDVSFNNGAELFKDFERLNSQPNFSFYQGVYAVNTTTQVVNRPIVRYPRHFLTTRTITPAPVGQLLDDVVVTTDPVELHGIYYSIYDELTGDLISEEELNPDGEIEIDELVYVRRFPFYNELVSFVTPYGIGVDFGQEGKSWYFDMTDYASILKGDKRLLMTLGGQYQEEMDLEFVYTVGTPARDVVKYDQLWQGTNRAGHANISQIATNQKFARMAYDLDADAESFKIRSSITGHGSEGEFGQNGGIITHNLALNAGTLSSWQITQECDMNPIFPQGGTWVIDRQGWCPGERSLAKEVDFTDDVSPGSTVTFDYSTSAPLNPNGDYRYHVAHQVVSYGAPNFQQDVSLVKVVAPNNTAEYTRTGTICADPQVVIRNSGATVLESATITYWINDSSSPQTFEWTGDLEFMEEEVVSIPAPRSLWYDIRGSNNVFWAEVDQPNDGADEYSNNNLVSSPFDFPEILPREMEFRVRTNNAPNENVYAIYNSAGDVVATNPLTSSNTTYTEELTLGEDCYRIVFRDTGGDGLEWWANAGQGAGSARLIDGFGNVIKGFEPDFGGGFEYSFSTNFALSAEELAFLSSIQVYPNPTSDFATISLENTQDVDIQVVDVLGRAQAVSVVDRSSSTIRLDVQSLTKGVYFVVIRKGDLHTTRRVERF